VLRADEQTDDDESMLRDRIAQRHPAEAAAAVKGRIGIGSSDVRPALVVTGVGIRSVLSSARKLKLDYVWQARSGVTAVRLTEGKMSIPRAGSPDEQASLFGGSLPSVLEAGGLSRNHTTPKWVNATKPGWVQGGSLQMECEKCDRPLLWADWWNADAAERRNNAFVFCPCDGGPVTRHRGRSLRSLISARQQLDGAVWAQNTDAKPRTVYAFTLLGLGHEALYVGETSKTPLERCREHKAGIKPAQILKSGRAQKGKLCQARLPHLPALHSSKASLAAEHWASLWLSHQGVDVHGNGLP
jgi:hypothetical protein